MKRTIKITANDNVTKVQIVAKIDSYHTMDDVNRMKATLTDKLHEALLEHFFVTEIKINK